MIIKTIFLVSFVLASALASNNEPIPAALLVQSNVDFSLTLKEFRVHYGGLGSNSASSVSIKIYEQDDAQPVLTYDLDDEEKKTRKAFHFALQNVKDGTYEVEVCADNECSKRTPSLTDVSVTKNGKIACKQGKMNQGIWVPDGTTPIFEIDFVGPSENPWTKDTAYTEYESKINAARQKAGLPDDFQTDYKKHDLSKNPTFKKNPNDDKGIFYVSFEYDLSQYKKLFYNKKRAEKEGQTKVYSHDICSRKYQLSAHAHVVNKKNHKVEHRFKTTLFLSEGGKYLFILKDNPEKAIVEITNEDAEISKGDYTLWVSICTTDKDAIESTLCAEPVITDLKVE